MKLLLCRFGLHRWKSEKTLLSTATSTSSSGVYYDGSWVVLRDTTENWHVKRTCRKCGVTVESREQKERHEDITMDYRADCRATED